MTRLIVSDDFWLWSCSLWSPGRPSAAGGRRPLGISAARVPPPAPRRWAVTTPWRPSVAAPKCAAASSV